MGIYAVVCCHAQLEFISPIHISRGSIKVHHLTFHTDLCRLVMHLMINGSNEKDNKWSGVEVVTDDEHTYEFVKMNYTDVTKVAIEAFNTHYDEQFAYTP